MAKTSWFQACKKAVQMYLDRDKYAYFYGAKGQKLTKATMDALWNAEPGHFSKYSAEEKAQIYKNSLNKIGYDCSGFVCKVTGETGYSIEILEKATKETTLTNGVAGQFLFTTWGGKGRHIGLDVGLGFQLDMGWESTDANVAKHKDSVHLARVKDVAWERSFQTAAVDYTGSYATDPTVNNVPKSKTAVVYNCDALYLRQGPSKQTSPFYVDFNDGKGTRCLVYPGEELNVVGEADGWYQINVNGKFPWVSGGYVYLK